MTEEQKRYYKKGAYEVGMMLAMLIDRHIEEMRNSADLYYEHRDVNPNFADKADAYEYSASTLEDKVSKILVGDIDRFIAEVEDEHKSRCAKNYEC